jgi:geranylgeranyl diphosphate synthase type II
LKLPTYFKQQLRIINEAIDNLLPKAKIQPAIIHEAMRYGVLNGGKRFRPILLLATAEACGGKPEQAISPAMAVELIHAYSLIHDDLPCMDDDDFRRGKPSCHKKFGEAHALLAGDALLTLTFEILSRVKPAGKSQRLAQVLAHAIGTAGMIGGQVMDKLYENRAVDLPTLSYIHVHKTGQLIRACCQLGAINAGARSAKELALTRFGEYLGFAFQVIDDIIDSDGYTKLMSVEEAREDASALVAKAKEQLKPFGRRAQRLHEIADFVLRRKH